MFSILLMLNLLVIVVKSSYSFPPFHGLNHHSRIENMVEPELHNNKIFQSNSIIGCDREMILNTVTLEEIQEMIESLAKRTGINSLSLIKKLNRRMRNKEELEETLIHSIEAFSHPERVSHPILDRPPKIELPPEASRIPYYLPPNMPMNDLSHDDTEVVIVPVSPMINRTPIGSNKISNMFHLRPPLGAIVRVNSGDPMSPISGDVAVTLSPFMNVIEVLRQADIKFQNILGLKHDSNTITFTHSNAIDCYVINSVDNVVNKEDSGWKISVVDRDGQMVYDSFCLPTDALVKPGTVISLTYVPL